MAEWTWIAPKSINSSASQVHISKDYKLNVKGSQLNLIRIKIIEWNKNLIVIKWREFEKTLNKMNWLSTREINNQTWVSIILDGNGKSRETQK